MNVALQGGYKLTDGCEYSALVFVEGEASYGSYTDAEGVQRKALNIIQRMADLPYWRVV